MFTWQPVRSMLSVGLVLFSALSVTVLAQPSPAEDPSAASAAQEKAATAKADAKAKDERDAKADDEPRKTSVYYEIIVTATRTEKDTFDIPNPVSVVGSEKIAQKTPNTITDLLRDLPGVDVNGVGTNQPRPMIRGQRGQRILLLEDGIRLNNSRQTSDFGEIPGLVDVSSVRRIEVVRGPASVLYGSDAIGGVVNMITHRPRYSGPEYLTGSASYRYSSADSQGKASVNVSGHYGKFGFLVASTYRESDDYRAPSGSFGKIHLADNVRVHDTGLRDDSLNARFEWSLGENEYLFVKAERYRSNNAGFGYVAPSDFNPRDAKILRITYPFQDVDQYSLGYRANQLRARLADTVSATIYSRANKRRFNLDLEIPFFPGAGMRIASSTFTDVDTMGTRVEATKLLDRHVVTYGLDAFRDDSTSTNDTMTSFFGFPRPSRETHTPPLPDATYTSYGVFVQDDAELTNRFSAIVGLRAQSVTAKSERTAGLPELDAAKSTDSAVVWATNLIYELSNEFKLVGTIGTSFRSPNLAERFFNGPTPEGSGFQRRNLDLEPEKGFNIDLGLKYRRERVYFELTAFRNRVKDGIAVADITAKPTPENPKPDPTFQKVNVDRLTFKGIECLFDWAFARNWSVGMNYTHLSSQNDASPHMGVSDSYSDKYNASLRYHDEAGRFWGEYHLRHNGEQSDTVIGKDNPLGNVFPSFTVHDLRGGFRLYKGPRVTHKLGLAIENLFNELYAEFSNAQFFRPQPERSFLVTWTVEVD